MKGIKIDSIVINGVRYDAVEEQCKCACDVCDLRNVCASIEMFLCRTLTGCCNRMLGDNKCFRKSEKQFEL